MTAKVPAITNNFNILYALAHQASDTINLLLLLLYNNKNYEVIKRKKYKINKISNGVNLLVNKYMALL